MNDLLTNLANQANKLNQQLYSNKQQGLLKLLGYFLGFAVIRDILTWKKPCYKECAKKCSIEETKTEKRKK